MLAARELTRFLLPAAFLCLPPGPAQPAAAQAPPHQHGVERLHRDPAAYIAALEDPRRDAYQKPQEVMEALAVNPGEVIADIGAGSGYFALRLAHHVGPGGHVYAVDVSPDMIRHLNARIRDAGLRNISTILAPPDDPLLPAAVDRFVFVNVWHHVDDQAGYLSLMKKGLKPGGQVVMIDFHKRDLPVGPPAGMKIAREDLLAQMREHGFRLVREHTFLPYQYFLVFEAGDETLDGQLASAWDEAALFHQPRMRVYTRDAEPHGFAPGTTAWRTAAPPDSRFAIGGPGTATTRDTPGELLAAFVAEALGATLGAEAWEATGRVLTAGEDRATGAVLLWGLQDDAVAGMDYRLTMERTERGWHVSGLQERFHCARRVADDLCA